MKLAARANQPSDYVQRLALEKARAAVDSETSANNFIVIGADTVVVNAGEILLKPDSPDDARRMLRQLSGGVHEVHTGLAVIRMPQKIERVIEEVTSVHFASLSDAEIDAYIATGEPFDKAGAYGIQSLGGRYVTRVEGCYFNVMGMPLGRLWATLKEFGWSANGPPRPRTLGNGPLGNGPPPNGLSAQWSDKAGQFLRLAQNF